MKAIFVTIGMLGTCSACASQVAPAAGAIAAMTQNSLSLQDRADILDLLSRYSHIYEKQETEAWVSLFEDDAVLIFYNADGFMLELTSNAERLVRVGARHQMHREKGIQPRHYQTNTLLTVNGDGSISGETLFSITVQHLDENTPRLIHTGVYRDQLVQSQSGWKFARREVWIDHK